MADRLVTGVFDNYSAAEGAIEALRLAEFNADDISLAGPDTDEFRVVTAHLHSKAPDRYCTLFGAVGALLGGLTWLLVAVALPSAGTASVIGPLLALFSGIMVGAAIGIIAGATINFDNPEYTGRVFEADLSIGVALVAVRTRDSNARMQAENVLEGAGAIETSSASTAAILGGLKDLEPLAKA